MGTLRLKFAVAFLTVALVVGGAVAWIVTDSLKSYAAEQAEASLELLGDAFFKTLRHAMNTGDPLHVQSTLEEIKAKGPVDRFDLYPSPRFFDKAAPPPAEAEQVFRQGSPLTLQTKEQVRVLRPLTAETICLKCHTTVTPGEVLGVMDLTLQLSGFTEKMGTTLGHILLSLAAIALAGVAAMLLFSGRMIFRPLTALGEAARKLADETEGLEVRLPVRADDEVGRATRHFNRFITRVQKINANLTLSEKNTRLILDSQPGILVVTDGRQIIDVNQAFFRLLPEFDSLEAFQSRHQCICEYFEEIHRPGYVYPEIEGRNWVEYVLEGRFETYRALVKRPEGDRIFRVTAQQMESKEGIRFLVGLSDITELEAYRRNLEEKVEIRTREIADLNRELRDYVRIVDENVIISKTDLKGNITYASDAFCRISGYAKEELMGKPHNIVRHPEMAKEAFKELWDTVRKGEVWKGEVLNRTKEGGRYWVDATVSPLFDSTGKPAGYMAVRQDITDQKELEETLRKLREATERSVTDPLTGLYNRNKVDDVLAQEITRQRRYGGDLAILIADIDHFKRINDTYGHLAGDEVLKAMATLLRRESRKSDLVARWGGEEFVLLLPGTSLEQAVLKRESLRKALAALKVGEVGEITASFGAALLRPEDDADSLFRRADRALYRAKANGRNRVEPERDDDENEPEPKETT